MDFGAPPETAYESNPHLGSNKIRNIIYEMSTYLRAQGCEFIYNNRVEKLLYADKKVVGVELKDKQKLMSDYTILATGHSAKEMYEHLLANNVAMQAKDFAVGVRIEHPRKLIDSSQHGEFCTQLESARYRLSYYNEETTRGTYSFCMCPGGYVLSSGTDKNGIVVNGMSNFARNSPWSNSALVVTIRAGKDFPQTDVLAGLHFQEAIEQKAFSLSQQFATGRELPAISVGEFMKGKVSADLLPVSSSPSKIFKANFADIFPKFIIDHLKMAIYKFNEQIPGFASKEALLIAPETRTSAPITILRDRESLRSESHLGLYPCGEGAGYAGGITSAAVDGIKVVESIVKDILKCHNLEQKKG